MATPIEWIKAQNSDHCINFSYSSSVKSYVSFFINIDAAAATIASEEKSKRMMKLVKVTQHLLPLMTLCTT